MNIFKNFGIKKSWLLKGLLMAAMSVYSPIDAKDFNVGTAEEFFSAIQNSQKGDTVKLTQDIMSRDYGSSGVRTVDLKGITLDGGGHQLHLVSMPISLSGESTIKNINLSLENTTGISLDISSDINRDDTVPIYANGYNLTFDNVDTTVRDNGTVKPNIQPTIYLGGDQNSNISATNTFKVINSVEGQSKFKNIVAGSNNAQKTGKSIIELSDGVQITGGRTTNIETPNVIKAKNMGANVENSPLTVEIKNSSKYINGFDQGSATNLKLELLDAEMFSGIKTNQKISELLVNGNSTLIVDNNLSVDKLVLKSTDDGNPKVDINLRSGANFNIDTLVSDANSTITNNTVKYPSFDDDEEPANSQDVNITNIEGEVKITGNTTDIKLPENYKPNSEGIYQPENQTTPPAEPEEPSTEEPEQNDEAQTPDAPAENPDNNAETDTPEPPANDTGDNTQTQEPTEEKPSEPSTDAGTTPEQPEGNNQTEGDSQTDNGNQTENNNVQGDQPAVDKPTENQPPTDNVDKDETKPEVPPAVEQPEEKPPTEEQQPSAENDKPAVDENAGTTEQPENPPVDNGSDQESSPPSTNGNVDSKPENPEVEVPNVPEVNTGNEQQEPEKEPNNGANDTQEDQTVDNNDGSDNKLEGEEQTEENNPPVNNNENQENQDAQDNQVEDNANINKVVEVSMNKLNKLNAEMTGIKSLTASLATLNTVVYDPMQPTTFMAGVGSFGKSSSFAMGVHHYIKNDLAVHGNVAYGASGNDHLMGNIGIVWKAGKKNNDVRNYGKTVERKVILINENLDKLEEKLKKLDAELNKVA